MATGLTQEIADMAEASEYPDGHSYESLSLGKIRRLSKRHHIPGRHVEIAALETGVVPERYSRNMKTFSFGDQRRLLESRVGVVGLGGLGGGVVEILARIGVGTLDIVDGDSFAEGNLNRQLLCSEKNLGETKTAVAAERIKEVNSSVVVHAHQAFLNETNAADMLAETQVIVDCLGGLEEKFVLEKAAKKVGRPLVSAAVAGLSGHLITVFPEDKGLQLIYGKKEALPSNGAEAMLGCLPQMTTLMAALQCSEVAKVLLKKGTLLRNRMLAVDLQDNTSEIVKLC